MFNRDSHSLGKTFISSVLTYTYIENEIKYWNILIWGNIKENVYVMQLEIQTKGETRRLLNTRALMFIELQKLRLVSSAFLRHCRKLGWWNEAKGWGWWQGGGRGVAGVRDRRGLIIDSLGALSHSLRVRSLSSVWNYPIVSPFLFHEARDTNIQHPQAHPPTYPPHGKNPHIYTRTPSPLLDFQATPAILFSLVGQKCACVN